MSCNKNQKTCKGIQEALTYIEHITNQGEGLINEKNIDFTRTHDLTIEEIRACTLFAHLSDEAALDILGTFKEFSLIIYDHYKKSQKIALNPHKNDVF